jgi:thiamine-phosphate pyrophosphorylase
MSMPTPSNAAETDRLAQAIRDAHLPLQLGMHRPLEDCRAPDDEGLGWVARAAIAAARSLGFIERDAAVVARAWQARADRTGQVDPAAWPDDPADFGLMTWPRASAFAPCPRALGLYAVLPDASHVAPLAQAGVPTLQLRFKSPDAAQVRAQVRQAVAAVRGTDARLFINDHWQEAIEAGAYGVHLGQEDLDTADLAAIRAAGLRLGLSTHGYAEMLRADALSPSYIAMGAVYATTLKDMPTAPQGPTRLAVYARLLRDHSLVAIGGIDEARFAQVLPSGVGSVAVVRAIVGAPDPVAAARQLMQRMAGAMH